MTEQNTVINTLVNKAAELERDIGATELKIRELKLAKKELL